MNGYSQPAGEDVSGEPEERLCEELPGKKPAFSLHVSPNRLAAYLRVRLTREGQSVDTADVFALLEENGVVYGVRRQEIEAFCAGGTFYDDLLCAQGLPPVDGEAGSLRFAFDTAPQGRPGEREDGTVDYRNLRLVQSVKAGDILCSRVPAKPGSDGVDVYGQSLTHCEGSNPPFPAGDNTVESGDGLSLAAAVDGCVLYKNRLVSVSSVFTVRGDVNHTTGSIRFGGSIVVHGDVREGFRLEAGEDILIHGSAEGADIQAGQNITISGGMNGMAKGALKAGGDISGKYFENVRLEAGGSIYADTMLHSRARAGGSIVMQGRRAALLGGQYEACETIYANTIGTPSYLPTTVVLSAPAIMEAAGFLVQNASRSELSRRRETIEKGLRVLEKQQAALMSRPNDAQGLLKAVLKKKGILSASLREAEEQLRAGREMAVRLTDFKVIALLRAFPGVKVVLGPHVLRLNTDCSSVKFYPDVEGVATAQVLPSDKR